MANYFIKKYFELFSNKDLEGLKNLYDDNIILKDWNGNWNGKQAVINMNNNLFQNVKFLKINIKDQNQINNRSYCHIDIKVDDVILDVIDVIDWTEDLKIKKIEAFNGSLK